MSPVPAAVLWDMDGTIADTEPWFIEAVTALVEADGGALSGPDLRALIGASMAKTAEIARGAGARQEARDIVAEATRHVRERLRGGVPWRPGALELLSAVRAAGLPTALVTMSFRSIAAAVTEAIGFAAFDAVVAGDEVGRGKPHPEAYLRAAGLLDVPIHRCVVIEDSPTGVRAGVAAGAAVVAVPCYVPLPASDAYTTWDTLVGKDVASLQRVAQAWATRPAAAGRRQ